MRRFARALKLVAAYVLYYMGVLRVWQAVALRGKAVVLMYHRVLDAEDRRRTGSHPGIIVSRDTFAAHMALLKRRFVVLSADDFTRHLREGRRFPDSSCLITFDDGWKDNFTNALPVLRRLELPAVVFLPASYIGQRRLFWREALTHMVVKVAEAGRRDASLRARCAAVLAEAGLQDVLSAEGSDVRPAIVEAIRASRALTWDTAQRVIAALAVEVGVRPEEMETPDDFMDWEQVRAMRAAGVAFGGHGGDHRVLTELTPAGVEAEIQTSKEALSGELTGEWPAFSYPNGAWTPAIAEMVARHGFAVAFTTVPGFVQAGDHPMELKRINIHETATSAPPLFMARLVGLL